MCVGRFQPFTQGHLNMVNEGETPCIIYQIKPQGIPETLKGLKVLGRVIKKDSVENVIKFLDIKEGDLTEQENDFIKRPFTNELISKELDIIKKNNKNIIDVVYVQSAFHAFVLFNKFLSDNKDKYEAQYWMCGEDRIDDYQRIINDYVKGEKVITLEHGGEPIEKMTQNLELNTGKGRTEGISGTDVRKAILNNDKSAFCKIMPKGTDILFDEFVESFETFKEKIKVLVKESFGMMPLRDYIMENKK